MAFETERDEDGDIDANLRFLRVLADAARGVVRTIKLDPATKTEMDDAFALAAICVVRAQEDTRRQDN